MTENDSDYIAALKANDAALSDAYAEYYAAIAAAKAVALANRDAVQAEFNARYVAITATHEAMEQK